MDVVSETGFIQIFVAVIRLLQILIYLMALIQVSRFVV